MIPKPAMPATNVCACPHWFGFAGPLIQMRRISALERHGVIAPSGPCK
jgi:hypothetical protein